MLFAAMEQSLESRAMRWNNWVSKRLRRCSKLWMIIGMRYRSLATPSEDAVCWRFSGSAERIRKTLPTRSDAGFSGWGATNCDC